MKFTGKITRLTEVIEVGKEEKKTQKRVMCVEEVNGGDYPNRFAVDFVGQKVDLLDGFLEGDIVDLDYNMGYNAFDKDGKTSIYNSIRGWRLTKVGQAGVTEPKSIEREETLPF